MSYCFQQLINHSKKSSFEFWAGNFRGLALIGKLLRSSLVYRDKLFSKPAGYQLEFLTMPKTMFVLIIALSFLQAIRGASKYATIVLILCFSVSIPFS